MIVFTLSAGYCYSCNRIRIIVISRSFRVRFQTTRTIADWELECRISSRPRTARPRRQAKTCKTARKWAPPCRRPGTSCRTRWPCPTGTWPPPTCTIIITRSPPCGTRAASTAEWVSTVLVFVLLKHVFRAKRINCGYTTVRHRPCSVHQDDWCVSER